MNRAQFDECLRLTRLNQWVSGGYDLEPIDLPFTVPEITEPKVSVVITNYNYAQYLDEAIQSVLNQTYQPFEILVVDDYSTDNSKEIIEKYPVTKVYRNHNGGAGASRNDGLSRTTGDYFLLLDADDRLKPTAIEEMVKSALLTRAEVTYGDMEVFGGRADVRQGIWTMPEYTTEGMLREQIVPSVCALIDRHVFSCSGGFSISTLFEDWFWYLHLSHNMKLNFQHIPVVCLEYRTHQKCRSDLGNPKREETMREFRKHFPMLV